MLLRKNVYLIFLLSLFVYIFKSWFYAGTLTSGDFLPFFGNTNLDLMPYAWGWNLAIGGLGGNISSYSWLHPVLVIPPFLGNLMGTDFSTTQKFFYLYPLFFLLIFSPFFFSRKFFTNRVSRIIYTLVFSLNTYILMIIGGGQIFIALAYSLAPFILSLYIGCLASFEKKSPKNIFPLLLTIGLLFGTQIILDFRIAMVFLFGIIFYTFFIFFNKKIFSLKILIIPVIILISSVLLNFFWILPAILTKSIGISSLGDIYTSSKSLDFFSFARLENTLSLLHPNWPENLFGKVYFMRSEFIFIPFLVFSSLLFFKSPKISTIKKDRKNELAIFFSLLGLFGAFLAKGTNDPFGGIYSWLFDNIPGFVMFRDPTKFYLLIVLSYSFLIPFSLEKISKFIKEKYNFNGSHILTFSIFILFWSFLINPALAGQLGGMFESHKVPPEYFKLKDFLSNKKEFYRTLWVPTYSRFGYYSDSHSVIRAQQFLNEIDLQKLLKKLSDKSLEKTLVESGIKYIIIPYDLQGEIFLKDGKYNNEEYLRTIEVARNISYLKEVKGFGRIAVFEILNPKDHFWSKKENLVSKIKYINPTLYEVEVKNAKRGNTLVFAENYDSYWYAVKKEDEINNRIGGVISSTPYETRLNSFVLKDDGDYVLKIFYLPQKWVHIGLFVSGATLIISFFVIIYTYKKK